MPPPVQWEACPEPVDPSLSCQQMKPFWLDPTLPFQAALAFFPKVWPVPGSSRVLLQFSRLNNQGNPDARYHIVSEADGPVQNALLQVNPYTGGCYLQAEGLRDQKYLWNLNGDTWDEPGFGSVEGFLAGDVGSSLPSTVVKQPMEKGLASDWDLTADWVIQKKGPRFVRPWDNPTQATLIYGAAQDLDGLSAPIVVPQGSAVVFGLGDVNAHALAVWTQAKGVQPLQRWPGDFTRGAGNVGTDGKDLVWTYGEGKKAEEEEFAATSVFTAPYATEMSAVEMTKRRLRSDVTRPGDTDYQYAVGCGYAARRYYLNSQTSNLFVVRLSDGRGWKIPGSSDGDTNHIYWANPLAISCEHIYVSLVIEKQSATIARLPLASLGPGLSAD